MGIITLTTDFGTDDWFVGTMKGVIASKALAAKVIDLSHGIAPGDIRAGAFALMAGYRYFPHQSVHVAVVDPGVGSERSAIVVDTKDYFFIGPDNGVLSWALRNEEVREIWRLENPAYFLDDVSRTFHGRDVFAPIAAAVSEGMALSNLGSLADNFVKLSWPDVERIENEVRGEILYIDHFGNALTNIAASDVRDLPMAELKICLNGEAVAAVGECYSTVDSGKPVGIFGSSRFLELAVKEGSAAQTFLLKTGTKISLRA